MTQIAWVEEAEIDCEPGAELCGACKHVPMNAPRRCAVFGLLQLTDIGNSRRCPACLTAERWADMRRELRND